jgi:phage shock protein PspC (stress-responsive transcriptional regulator)
MAGTPDPAGVRRLRRPIEGKKIAGVCAAFARYLNLDVTLVRIVIAMLAVYPVGLGVIFYIIAWIAIPQEPWAPPAVVMHEENPAGAPGA